MTNDSMTNDQFNWDLGFGIWDLRRRRRGFTLLEVLIAIFIIGLSFTILLGSYLSGLQAVSKIKEDLSISLLVQRKLSHFFIPSEKDKSHSNLKEDEEKIPFRISKENYKEDLEKVTLTVYPGEERQYQVVTLILKGQENED